MAQIAQKHHRESKLFQDSMLNLAIGELQQVQIEDLRKWRGTGAIFDGKRNLIFTSEKFSNPL